MVQNWTIVLEDIIGTVSIESQQSNINKNVF